MTHKPSVHVREDNLKDYAKGRAWAQDQIAKSPGTTMDKLAAQVGRLKFPAFHRLVKQAPLSPPSFETASRLLHTAVDKRNRLLGNDWRGRADRAFWLGVQDASQAVMDEWFAPDPKRPEFDRLQTWQEEATFKLLEHWESVHA